MSNLYIPFCSLVLGLFLIVLFITKVKRFKNSENIYYFAMILNVFLASVLCILAIYLIYKDYDSSIFVKLYNQLECFMIINFH